jgi:hypothetical protein
MKRMLLAIIASGITMCGFGQADSTKKADNAPDTIIVGGMVIIKQHHGDSAHHNSVTFSTGRHRYDKKPTNLSTNWWIVDLGFANYSDNTNYNSTETMAFAPGMNKDNLSLRTGKSVNVDIWFFMQRLNMIKHVLNLKYGLGMELNNYRFDNEQVRFTKNPTVISLDNTLKDADKNKLAADYITVPLMLNLNFTPKRSKGFGLSAGVSGGYLYSSRQKIKMGDHKDKLHDDFDLRKWKLAYIGELSLGPVRLYGSYAMKSMWEKGLDQTPYSLGIRLSRW